MNKRRRYLAKRVRAERQAAMDFNRMDDRSRAVSRKFRQWVHAAYHLWGAQMGPYGALPPPGYVRRGFPSRQSEPRLGGTRQLKRTRR